MTAFGRYCQLLVSQDHDSPEHSCVLTDLLKVTLRTKFTLEKLGAYHY